ncbi:MAG TPA: adaptor protein MecA [Clostridiales bacterium]|nr:adaptor protein MecA [Clostridiales bacterium]
MTIHLEEPWRLRVTLSAKELLDYQLTFDDLDYNCPETRKILGLLIQAAAEQTNFNIDQGKLLIEVFPGQAGGCTIYFTKIGTPCKKQRRLKIKKSTPSVVPYIFEFASSGDMLSAVEQLYMRNEFRDLKSKLYLLDGKYRLIIYPDTDENFTVVLGEFAEAVYRKNIATAYTTEYGKLLAGDNAIKKIGKALAVN